MAVKKAKSTRKSTKKMATNGMSTLGDYIAMVRENTQKTQVEFAKKLGMSKQNLCDLERGRRNTTPKTAVAFAKKLGISPDKLVRLVLQDMVNRDGLRFKVEVRG